MGACVSMTPFFFCHYFVTRHQQKHHPQQTSDVSTYKNRKVRWGKWLEVVLYKALGQGRCLGATHGNLI